MDIEKAKEIFSRMERIGSIDGALEALEEVKPSKKSLKDLGDHEYDPDEFYLIVSTAASLDLSKAKVGPEIVKAIKRELTTIKEKLLKEVEEL